ncbi:tyrosine-type recombinase/integrase [Caballeronia humi]|uniref:tyrosine-type recombinase/integrase n=1 Tax=Caballeronia humi TaxID=326474 RepID=UPI001F230BF3|nr:tyrosine-type recombinase/integrase [Caballeronia humi]
MTGATRIFPLPKKPFRLPVVLSLEEITTFFDSIASLKHRAILMVAYAAGLRVSEVVHLKVTDIDSKRKVIRVNQGKNRKEQVRDALAAAARDPANVLARRPPARVAVSGQHSRPTHQSRCHRTGMPDTGHRDSGRGNDSDDDDSDGDGMPPDAGK